MIKERKEGYYYSLDSQKMRPATRSTITLHILRLTDYREATNNKDTGEHHTHTQE